MNPPLAFQFYLILAISHFTFTTGVAGEDCSVSTAYGTVIGTIQETLNSSKNICSYLGIPFAAPPVGSLRFNPPQPADPWTTPLNATKQPNWCPQSELNPPSGVTVSEDCLYLNVYQPRLNNNGTGESLPVMIWIHGGGFTSGSSYSYTPDRLLARGDLILVVIHYRLGLLGFLSTGDLNSPGNFGLKDQSFAIRWVNENIQAFGGNSSQVTVFGESAGSASVLYQLISPLNKGLIHGVIAQSGAVLASWALDREPQKSARTMAIRVGCPIWPNWLLVTCMRIIPWQVIVLAQQKYTLLNYAMMQYAYATMTPVVEPNLPGAFITQEPLEIMKSGEVDNTVPVVLGATKHDGSFILAILHLLRLGPWGLDKNPEYLRNQFVPDTLKFFEVEADSANRATASSVELAYLAGVNRSSWEESMPGLVDIYSVFAFKSSILHTAELLSGGGSDVYLYSFEHHSNNTFWEPILANTPIEGGIAHADDLLYLFNFPTTFSEDDTTFSELFCDMWLNFGTRGHPTLGDSTISEQWPSYNAQDELYMKLNSRPTVLSDYKSSWRPNGFEWS